MTFREFGNRADKTIVLLHGGGLSWWAWTGVIQELKTDYHIVAAVIDGHGDAADTSFESIQKAAEHLVDAIQTHWGGQVYAIAGLSIGAQILVEALAQKNDLCKKAVIESGRFIPGKITAALVKSMISSSYFLIKYRWFSRMQARPLFVQKEHFEDYHRDSQKMSRFSLTNMLISNSLYELDSRIDACQVKSLILVGEKELGVMKRSARLLQTRLINSDLKIIPKSGHGEISMTRPKEYSRQLRDFFNQD